MNISPYYFVASACRYIYSQLPDRNVAFAALTALNFLSFLDTINENRILAAANFVCAIGASILAFCPKNTLTAAQPPTPTGNPEPAAQQRDVPPPTRLGQPIAV